MEARLVVLSGEDKGFTLPFHPGCSVTIGRDRGCTLVLRDEYCSRKHAEIVPQADKWLIRDLESKCGTYVNGIKVDSTVLEDGQEIRVGKVHLRFTTNPISDDPITPVSGDSSHTPPPKPADTLDDTALEADDLSSLCKFMTKAVDEGDAWQLVRDALEMTKSHTKADVVGFLGLNDTGGLVSRLVLPAATSVNYQLSRNLTQRAERDRQPVWLQKDFGDSGIKSLMSYCDAICVPLLAGETILGTLHVYRKTGPFSDREYKFCRALGGHLASTLKLLRKTEYLDQENQRLQALAPEADQLVGESLAIERLRQLIKRVLERIGSHPCTVLIRGESGVGKELVARQLHRHRQGQFLPVNCATITPGIGSRELFGHRKGGFTSATEDRPGFFQSADDGTLFLDEIGDLSPECQTMLLRVLDDSTIQRVGDPEPMGVNVRVIAATNRDLEENIRAGKFRPDLYHRLSVLEIRVPPLREHTEDIPALVDYYLDKFARLYQRDVTLSPAARDRLARHQWPGNVRELRNTLERAVLTAPNESIDAADISFGNDRSTHVPPSWRLQDLERWAIERALHQTHHRVAEAAALLGIARATLYAKIKEYGIHVDRAPGE